ncbi:methyltransferase [Candidatus Bathyarchaeota archaeon]|nr:MAG: methyltransferase [Candidatus Bathyarchaeota archaeon]
MSIGDIIFHGLNIEKVKSHVYIHVHIIKFYVNSRDRVTITLKHEEPDRIPIDLGSMPSTGITALAYVRLKRYLGLKGGKVRVYDVGQQLAEPEEEILNLFHVDVIDLRRSLKPCGPDLSRWKKWVLPDGTTCEIPSWFNPEPNGYGGWVVKNSEGRIIMKMPKNSFYFDSIYHPLEKAKSQVDIHDYDWDSYKIPDSLIEIIRRKAEFLYKNTDYAIMAYGAGSVHEWGQSLRGWSNWLVDLTLRKSIASAMLDHMVDILLHNLSKYLDAVKDYVQIIGFGDDLGVQTGPQISPRVYREMLKPYHEQLFHYVKQHSKLFVFLHSCGSIYKLIPDLIDAGVDVLNPVQISAKDMKPERLKREFGEQLSFWGGGVDTQHVLPFSSPSDVALNVRRNISVFAPGGGYVFNQVHNIQAKVPPENIVAMFKTAYKYGKYPLH